MFALGAFILLAGSNVGQVRTVDADHDGQITVKVDSDPEGGTDYDFEITILQPDGCSNSLDGETFTLDDDETSNELEFNCDAVDLLEVRVSVDAPVHSVLSSIDCTVDEEGENLGDVSTFDSNVGSERVDIDITDREHVHCLFDFDFDSSLITPTATATTEVGPAATINVSSSNANLGCGATSIVTITVRGANGQAVLAGTLVNIVANQGSVSPASGQTTADGSVFVFYTAPTNAGGAVTITAASGSALGTTAINVNCSIAPTQAPPPTTAPSGGIQPPNTGDAGLSTSNSWQPYAGVALILASVLGTLAVIRPRA